MTEDEEAIYKSFMEFAERNEDVKKSLDNFMWTVAEALIQIKRELEEEREDGK